MSFKKRSVFKRLAGDQQRQSGVAIFIVMSVPKGEKMFAALPKDFLHIVLNSVITEITHMAHTTQ
jgi:hypothetical protein